MEFTITAESTPILDGWGYDEYWDLSDWMKWHALMKKENGKEYAKSKFLFYWNKQDSTAAPYNWGKYDKIFNDYLVNNGIDIGNFVSKILNGATNAAGSLGDATAEAGKGAKNTAKVLKYAIPVLVIAVLIVVVLIIYKKSKSI